MFGFIHKVERKIEMDFIEKLVAKFVERVFKSYVTTVLGILLGSAAFVGAIYGLIPSTLAWHGYLVAATLLKAAGVASALAGIIAKDENIGINHLTLPNANKTLIVLLMLGVGMLFPFTAYAQTTTTAATTTTASETGFTASSDALALHFDGTWSAATLIGESYPFINYGKTKSNTIYVKGFELEAPTPGWNIYAAGVGVKPDFSSWLKKTNVPSDNLAIEFTAAIGNGVPENGGSHVSALAGAIVSYRATSSLTWNALTAQWVRYGPKNGVGISMGIAYIFGQK